MSPHTAETWLAVAKERATDAQAINKHRPTSVGAVYLAGYAIECSLKALLQKRGTEFPKHGREGHNLRNLWAASKFRLSDLRDVKGSKAFFIDKWDTALRYDADFESSIEIKELLQGAKELTGYIQNCIRRQRRHR